MNFDIAHMACDSESRRILTTTNSAPRSVREIAEECRLPLGRCYRLIKDMESNRLLKKTDYKGTRGSLFISNLQSLLVSIEGDKVHLKVIFRDGNQKMLGLDMGPVEETISSAIPTNIMRSQPEVSSTIS